MDLPWCLPSRRGGVERRTSAPFLLVHGEWLRQARVLLERRQESHKIGDLLGGEIP